MKTIILFSTTVAFLTLMVGLSLAADRARPAKGVLPMHRPGESHPTPNVKVQHEPWEKQSLASRSRSSPLTEPGQPRLDSEGVAEKGRATLEKRANHPELPAWPLVGGETHLTHRVPGALGKRTIAAASLGGPAAPIGRYSAAVINGSQMKRRP